MWVLVILTVTLIYTECRTNIPMGIFPYNGMVSNSSYAQLFQVDISAVPIGKNYYVTFNATNYTFLSYAFIAISNQQDEFKDEYVSPSSFYGKNYSQIQNSIDIVGMQLGKKQYINRIKKYNDTMLYMTVYNIDPQYRRGDVSFTINLQQSGASNNLGCYACNNYGQRANLGSSCLCNNCAPGYYGPDCSINMLSLTKNQVSTAFINGPAIAFFKIEQTSQINVLVKLSLGTGQAYFQFVQFQGQFASYTNVAVGKNVEGRFMVAAGTSGTKIVATSKGTPMSVTVAVFQDINTSVEVSYTVVQKSNILSIVLSVLGGALFSGLVLAAICIIKKRLDSNNSTNNVQHIRPAAQNLTDDQIQRFFPTVCVNSINRPSQQCSIDHINQNTTKKFLIQDCVICLCPIQLEQLIKVTYCRHIFHSHCLAGWFRKQQNCPYCRQQFVRTKTIKLYRKLKQIGGRNAVMKGQDLANAILAYKPSVVASKQGPQSLNQKQTQLVQIGSRLQPQAFSIQNLS